jgi:hypothetical protein
MPTTEIRLESSLASRTTFIEGALVERFGGDPSSADWRHFGRLAGFTNSKPERQLPSGLEPFARLRSATGRGYSRAAEFLAGITTSSGGQAGQGEPHEQLHRSKARVGLKPFREFHIDPIYAGDLHRADMAWAKHAAGCGLMLEQIRDDLLSGRDLSKKGKSKRQLEYAERTARKAIEQMRGRPRPSHVEDRVLQLQKAAPPPLPITLRPLP